MLNRRTFAYKKEAAPNPWTGIVSFQHFRGDPLYSDSVVTVGGDLCETEAFECYPVTPGVPENGRSEGFYPDSTVAYIRVLWKEFEPRRGEYRFDFIDSILRKAESRGQTVMFRLMAHSTCARDDVPDWLKALIPCPERPDRMRVKDSPTDPLFIKLFCEAIRAIGAHFDSDPVLDIVDISMPGSWGEGHNLYLYPQEDLNALVDAYLEAFPTTQLLCQMGAPEQFRHACENGRRIGTRADGIGSPSHLDKHYPKYLAKLPSDIWRTAPFSAESYWWLCEWKRQGWDEDAVFDYMLRLHVSTFNPKSLPIPFGWEEKIDAFLSKMGYHFAIDSFSCAGTVKPGETLPCVLVTDNVGCAPVYHKVPLKVTLTGNGGTYVLDTDIDVRSWMPGKTEEAFLVNVPDHVPAGTYTVSVSLEGKGFPEVFFCSDAPRDGVRYAVGSVTVG